MNKLLILIPSLLCSLMIFAGSKEPTSYFYQRGIEALDEGDNEKALEMFDRELNTNPKNGYASLYRGAAYANLAKYDYAKYDFDFAIAHLPKKDKTRLASAYRLRAMMYLDILDTVAALSDYALAIKYDPTEYDYYEERAEIYYQLGDYTTGNADYLHMIELEPYTTTGYMGLGRNLMESEQYENAIDQFSYVMTLDSDYMQPYGFRGECYIKQHKYEEGISDLIKAISKDENRKAIFNFIHLDRAALDLAITQLRLQINKTPNQYTLYICGGLLHENLGLYGKAISYFREAQAVDPDTWYDSKMAVCYQKMGDFVNAIRCQKTVYDNDTTDAYSTYLIAEYYYELDSVDTALRWINRCIELAPDEAVPYATRAGFYYKEGRYEEALEDYNLSISLDSNTPTTYLYRGRTHQLLGDTTQAKSDYYHTIILTEIPDKDCVAQYAYLFLGDTVNATVVMEIILRNYPDSESEYDAACIYSLSGNTDLALQHLRLALEQGYRMFHHILKDPDLANLRATEGFRPLYDEYYAIFLKELQEQPALTNTH